MITAVLASVALLGTTVAATGSAIVINKCSYPVSLANTPASGGGYSTIPETLAAGGGSYSQQYTPLSNGDGWSLKLSQPNGNPDNILQYEYTFHNDGTIWFDLSEVNGNPWDGNWEITANNGCTPRQAAYRFATDDAYGMQACDDSASVTVTLCSGTSSGGGSQGPAPSSPPETSAAAPTSAAPTSAAPAPSNTWGGHHSWAVEGNKVESPVGKNVEDKKAPSTLVTTSVPWNGPAVTVTNLAFETVTQIVTATGHAHKHHARHPHHVRI